MMILYRKIGFWTLINGSCKYMQWTKAETNLLQKYSKVNQAEIWCTLYRLQVNILFYILVALIQLILKQIRSVHTFWIEVKQKQSDITR